MELLKPYERNFIRQQLHHLIQTVYFVGDFRTLRAIEESVEIKIGEVINRLNPEVKDLFMGVSKLRGQDEVNDFMKSLSPYVEKLPMVTTGQVRKLFPKVKKMQMPDFENIKDQALVYLGWKDVGTQSLYLVYFEEGKLHGLACRYTPLSGNKSSFCCLCNQSRMGSQIGLVTTKRSNELVSGNYMCLNSQECNNDLTDMSKLREFMGLKQNHLS